MIDVQSLINVSFCQTLLIQTRMMEEEEEKKRWALSLRYCSGNRLGVRITFVTNCCDQFAKEVQSRGPVQKTSPEDQSRRPVQRTSPEDQSRDPVQRSSSEVHSKGLGVFLTWSAPAKTSLAAFHFCKTNIKASFVQKLSGKARTRWSHQKMFTSERVKKGNFV